MTKPITPGEVASKKTNSIPPEVFEGFNEAIVKHWDGHSADFTQDEVITMILTKFDSNKKMTSKILFDNHYLDVEDSYRKAGWSVEYDKPGYCETYSAKFTFTKRGR